MEFVHIVYILCLVDLGLKYATHITQFEVLCIRNCHAAPQGSMEAAADSLDLLSAVTFHFLNHYYEEFDSLHHAHMKT